MSTVLSKSAVPMTSVHKVEADGIKVFYREAGAPTHRCAPATRISVITFMFRELIQRLADQFRVIAPDLPGFGFTEVPEGRNTAIPSTHWRIRWRPSQTRWVSSAMQIYVFDYGAPTGFRLAMSHPERITAIVSQNGNAYEEGLGDAGHLSGNIGLNQAKRIEM